MHIENCLSGDFLAKQNIRQQKVQKGDISEMPKKGKRNLKFWLPWFVKSENFWAPQWQKSHHTCCINYHVFFIVINMLHFIWFTEEKDFQVILPQSIFGNITLHKVAIENELKAVTACAWVQTNGSSDKILDEIGQLWRDHCPCNTFIQRQYHNYRSWKRLVSILLQLQILILNCCMCCIK